MKHKFVAAVVLTLSLSAIPAFAESTILSPTSDKKIDTHFYGIQARTIDLGFSAPWITSYKDSRVIVLGPDQNFPDNNPINGGLESKYPLALLTPQPLKRLH